MAEYSGRDRGFERHRYSRNDRSRSPFRSRPSELSQRSDSVFERNGPSSIRDSKFRRTDASYRRPSEQPRRANNVFERIGPSSSRDWDFRETDAFFRRHDHGEERSNEYYNHPEQRGRRSQDLNVLESRSQQRYMNISQDRDQRNPCTRQDFVVRPIELKRLQEMYRNETPENIIMYVGNPRSGLNELLRGDREVIDNGMIRMLLKVFSKMLDHDGHFPYSLNHILRVIMKNEFQRRVSGFIFGLSSEPNLKRQQQAPVHVTNALKLAKSFLNELPKDSEKEVSMMLVLIRNSMDNLTGVGDVEPLYQEVREMHEVVKSQNTEAVDGNAAASNITASLILPHEHPPPNDFRDIPVFPQLQDIQPDVQPFIRGNLTDRAYNDNDHYLDVQYRLLREDFIKPLRDGIEEFKHSQKQQSSQDRFQNVKVYEDVWVQFAVPHRKGVLHKIQFNTSQLRGIRWKNTKRLLYGNLLCLSSDDFQHDVLFAVVVDRNPDELEEGYLTVSFVFDKVDVEEEERESDGDDDLDDQAMDTASLPVAEQKEYSGVLSVDMTKVYTMVETDAYFEAYRHILAGLKETRNIPLQRYIVDCSKDMRAPEYLAKASNTIYDFSPLTHSEKFVDVLGSTWPSPDDLNLNLSQADAVKLSLTNELAIIQGPPGTGKTHVGLEIMKILLRNKSIWSGKQKSRSPILIVCYTNHALDQFLEGISKFLRRNDSIVRVGGRSRNEVAQKFSLYNIKKLKRSFSRNIIARTSSRNIGGELWDMRRKLQSKTSRLEASFQCILRLEQLKKVIPEKLFKQFSHIKNIGIHRCRVMRKYCDVALLSWLQLRPEEKKFDSKMKCSIPPVCSSETSDKARSSLLERHLNSDSQDFDTCEDDVKEEADLIHDIRLMSSGLMT